MYKYLFNSTYFALPNPKKILSRWINPYSHTQTVSLLGKPIDIRWTHRAQRQFHSRNQPLIVEMQLYFTCVVKKRVLFHKKFPQETTIVNGDLSVVFRTVEAESCDPNKFAKNYPEKQQLKSTAASKMRPSYLRIDYMSGNWQGEFGI